MYFINIINNYINKNHKINNWIISFANNISIIKAIYKQKIKAFKYLLSSIQKNSQNI